MPVKDFCDFCGGELKHGKIDLDIKTNGEIVFFEDIPAEVCKQCGEGYIDAETSKRIDAFLNIREREKPKRYIPVPVFAAEAVLI